MRYRPDIDGLRAVAVVAVLAFHFDYPGVPGGFVGVDVFFVISGFLITGLISKEIDAGTFTIFDFYQRRVRRLFPALFTMIAIVAVVAAFVALAPDMADLRNNILAATFFSSNIYFWLNAPFGGGGGPDTSEPLLHTWSLAVEEQYYLLFPLLLLAIARWLPRRRLTVIWAGSLLSLALSIVLLRVDAAATFYLLPTRAWELGVGALLALGALPGLKRPAARHVVSILGLGLIAVTVLRLQPSTPFPGEAALPPVLGAAALIYAGPTSLGGRLLALRPLVFVGLISYSLYLWHWPLLYFYRLDHPGDSLSTRAALALTAASAVAAVLSWRFVERPVRRIRFPSVRRLALAGGACMSVAAVLALLLQPASAVVNPQPKDVDQLLGWLDYNPAGQLHVGSCFIGPGLSSATYDRDSCLTRSATAPDYLLVGDVQAADLATGLQQALPGVHVLQATASGCKPTRGAAGRPACTALRDTVLDDYLPGQATPLDAVLLSARWQPGDLDRLVATATELRSRSQRVIVLGPRPEYRAALPGLLARGLADDDPGRAARFRLENRLAVDQLFRTRLGAAGVEYVSLIDALCTPNHCEEYAGPGVPLQFDTALFTVPGSRVLLDQIEVRLRPPA